MTQYCSFDKRIHKKGIQSFSFLDEDHLLLASISKSKQAAKLSVIDLNTLARFEFLFPKFSWELGPFDISISSGPEAPSQSISQFGTLPFQAATEDRLIIVELMDEFDTECSFAVLTWALQKEVIRLKNANNNVRHRAQYISWDKWGMHCTALLRTHTFFTPSFFSYGTRYITIEDETVVIYDFNRFAIRRAIRPDDMQNGQVSEINGFGNICSSPIFKHPVATTSLWRKLVTKLDLKGCNGIGIDNDWIILSAPVCWKNDSLPSTLLTVFLGWHQFSYRIILDSAFGCYFTKTLWMKSNLRVQLLFVSLRITVTILKALRSTKAMASSLLEYYRIYSGRRSRRGSYPLRFSASANITSQRVEAMPKTTPSQMYMFENVD